MTYMPLPSPEPVLVLVECEPINYGHGERRVYVHPLLMTRFTVWRNSPMSPDIWTMWFDGGRTEHRCANGFADVGLYLATEFAPERM